jgi:hypothetical protein
MPSKQQETRNTWITINFRDRMRQILAPVMNVEPFESSDLAPLRKPDGYKSSQSSSARIIAYPK